MVDSSFARLKIFLCTTVNYIIYQKTISCEKKPCGDVPALCTRFNESCGRSSLGRYITQAVGLFETLEDPVKTDVTRLVLYLPKLYTFIHATSPNSSSIRRQ